MIVNVNSWEARDSVTLRKLSERFAPAICRLHSFCGDDTAVIRREALVEIARFLKEDPELDYNFLMDITAVDYLRMPRFEQIDEGEPRFDVVYHFFSLAHKHRVRLRVPVAEEDAEVDSLVQLWPAANWAEREVYDMFGIRFRGHPDLRRILMYDEFQGHALRKDYPINRRQPRIPQTRNVAHPVPRITGRE